MALERLGMTNGLLTGISQAVQIVGMLAIPKLWNLLLTQPWLAQVLTWNIIGIICLSGFGLAWCIRLRVDIDEDN